MYSSTKKLTVWLLENIIFVFFLAAVVVFTLLQPSFLSLENLRCVILRSAIVGPVAFGIMLTVILGGLDLSAGCIVGIVGILIALAVQAGMAPAAALLLGLGLGAMVGAVNGFLIAYLKMNPFIATLSILFIGSSVEKVLTRGGLPIYLYGPDMPRMLEGIYRTPVGGVEIAIWILLAMIALYYLFLERSVFGRQFYVSGLSLKGARLVGIAVERFYFLAYLLSGASAAVSGLVVLSNVRSGQPFVGMSYLWDGLGGAFLSILITRNMRPNIVGAVFGVVVLAIIGNGLTHLNLNFYWKEFFKGMFILLILLASVVKRKVLLAQSA